MLVYSKLNNLETLTCVNFERDIRFFVVNNFCFLSFDLWFFFTRLT